MLSVSMINFVNLFVGYLQKMPSMYLFSVTKCLYNQESLYFVLKVIFNGNFFGLYKIGFELALRTKGG